ncbi:hypothetical protein D3C75_777900 [compost metagenome]
MDVDGTARRGDARRRLQRQVRNDRLTGGNTAENAAGVVAEETLRGHFIAMLGAALGDAGETGADFHALDRIDAHQRMGQFGIETVEDRFPQAWHHTLGHHGNFRADRILVAAQLVHVGFQFRHFVRVRAEEGVLLDRIPGLERDFNRPQLAHVAANDDALAGQVFFCNRTGRDAHRGFTGRAATATAVVALAVFVVVGVVGVGRAEQILDRRVVLGLLVGVADQQADRATGGAAFEHAGEDFHLVGFLALGGVAAGAGLAAVQVTLQILQGYLQPRRAAIDNGDQRRAMAFARGGDSEQLAVGIAGHAGRSVK